MHAGVTVTSIKMAAINEQLLHWQHILEKSFCVNQTEKNFVADWVRYENVVSYNIYTNQQDAQNSCD